MTITLTPINQPSSSKGWSRIKAVDATGKPVIQSATGNAWVSAAHSGEVEPGTIITVTTQKMLRSGKAKREEIYTDTYRIVAEDGASCIPGSIMVPAMDGGVRVSDGNSLVTISGARMAQ